MEMSVGLVIITMCSGCSTVMTAFEDLKALVRGL